ncbi:HutD family protein [Castellaniella caeni]
MHDTIRLIHAHELASAPCHHDAAITRQLAQYPAQASADDFLWRVSTTDIRQDGPLDAWVDIDRILLVTGDTPLCLTHTEQQRDTRLDYGGRLYFAGETPYRATLPEGPTHTFDLMFRRKQGHGCVDLRTREQQLPLRPGDTILHCLRGRFRASFPAHLGGERLLDTGDTLHITLDYVPFFKLGLTPLTPGARLADARLNLYPGDQR